MTMPIRSDLRTVRDLRAALAEYPDYWLVGVEISCEGEQVGEHPSVVLQEVHASGHFAGEVVVNLYADLDRAAVPVREDSRQR